MGYVVGAEFSSSYCHKLDCGFCPGGNGKQKLSFEVKQLSVDFVDYNHRDLDWILFLMT